MHFYQIVIKWEHFEKKVFKNLFSLLAKNVWFSEKRQKVLNFHNALWPNHLIYNKPKGIPFRWHPRTWNLPTCLGHSGPVKIIALYGKYWVICSSFTSLSFGSSHTCCMNQFLSSVQSLLLAQRMLAVSVTILGRRLKMKYRTKESCLFACLIQSASRHQDGPEHRSSACNSNQ